MRSNLGSFCSKAFVENRALLRGILERTSVVHLFLSIAAIIFILKGHLFPSSEMWWFT